MKKSPETTAPKTAPEPTRLITIKGGKKYKRRYHVTPVPGPKVEQLRLELITSFLNDLASIQKASAEHVQYVFDALESGAEVEPGGLMAEIRETTTAGSRTKRLYVNGLPVPEIQRF